MKKRKNCSSLLQIKGEKNYIVLFNDSGREIPITKPIRGLNLKVIGNHNRIFIHEKTIFEKSHITVESNYVDVWIDRSSLLRIHADLVAGEGQKLKIGRETRIGGAFFVLNEESACVIGKECLISEDVWFWGSDGHALIDQKSEMFLNRPIKAIEINDHCWIGHACHILKGGGLASDSVVGSRSILTRSFSEPNIALAGNPAKIIRHGVTWNGQSCYVLNQEKIKDQIMYIQPIELAFEKKENTVAVAFSSSDYYAPFLSVVLLSLADHANQKVNYDIVVFTSDMTKENQTYLKTLIVRKNISLRFVDVALLFNQVKTYVPWYVGIETYFRILSPKVFEKYPKVLFLDSDTLIVSDVAELYQTVLPNDCPLAATEELLFQAAFTEGNRDISSFLKTLGLSNPRRYFQAGVILFNCAYCNTHRFSQRLLNNIQRKRYEMVDQDALNELCADRHLLLSSEWNYPPLSKKSEKFLTLMPSDVKEKHQAVHTPKIIHFIGAYWKPWCEVDNEYDHKWWSYARMTRYYEELLKRLCAYSSKTECETDEISHRIRLILAYRSNKIKYIRYKILSKITFGKRRQKYKQKRHRLKEELRLTRRYMKEAVA